MSPTRPRKGWSVAPAPGLCDVPETCTGTSASCPSHVFESGVTVCRRAAGACDVAELCSGSGAKCPGNALAAPGTPCRAAAGECDVAEACTGSSSSCPANTVVADDEPCDDGDACADDTACTGGACAGGAAIDCSDGDLCTRDSCDAAGGCGHDAGPLDTCEGGFGNRLLSIDETRPGKEKLVVKLTRGPGLEQVELGDPLEAAGTAYALCLYDDADALVGSFNVDRAAALCGSKPCWKSLGGSSPDGKGYRYGDRDAGADGVSLVKLKGGEAGKSTVLVKGVNRADRGRLSLPIGVANALGSSTSATMHLVSDAGLCLEHTVADVRKQEMNRFVAR